MTRMAGAGLTLKRCASVTPKSPACEGRDEIFGEHADKAAVNVVAQHL
jgi:hypothetical protein